MFILVINSGSSSLKYQLIDSDTHRVAAKGICERVGTAQSFHRFGLEEHEEVHTLAIPTHDDAVALALETLVSGSTKVLDTLHEIDAVGHRVVQGGSYYNTSVVINDEVLEKIEELAELAPLHNRAALRGIAACKKHMPDVSMVAVFDTSFFQTLAPKSYMYPLPYELYERYGIRKYGAHGTSHRYVAQRAADFLGRPLSELKLITCHLGNGCSMSAIKGGLAIDTSMGLTPLDGLMMGTRCGAIDPAIVPFVMEHDKLTPEEMSDLMNKRSGLLGISGVSNDLRSVEEALEAGNKHALLATEMYAESIKKYIGQYMAVLGGSDAVIFTAGVGENSASMRTLVLEGLQPLGMALDPQRNLCRGGERRISTDDSSIALLVIPTNEEYMIARDTVELVRT